MLTTEAPQLPRLLILGAHPDDAEYHAGGLAAIYRSLGREVKLVSVTNGAAGHHLRTPEELVPLRRREAAAAGGVIDATYETWDFPDGLLQPTLEVRHRIIREIREFQPDLVLTHRTSDYHPDHRAVGQSVQDAAYLVTVPHVVPESPALRQSPVFAHMVDLFQRPAAMRPDVIIDVSRRHETIARMLACQKSQLFEWLAYEEDALEAVPSSADDRLKWVKHWYKRHTKIRADRFRQQIVEKWGPSRGAKIELVEVYEISEYGRQPDTALRDYLFPHDEIKPNPISPNHFQPSRKPDSLNAKQRLS